MFRSSPALTDGHIEIVFAAEVLPESGRSFEATPQGKTFQKEILCGGLSFMAREDGIAFIDGSSSEDRILSRRFPAEQAGFSEAALRFQSARAEDPFFQHSNKTAPDCRTACGPVLLCTFDKRRHMSCRKTGRNEKRKAICEDDKIIDKSASGAVILADLCRKMIR